jgi:oligopeptide/dipeptide ABC transporter ATP-binding protein
MNTSLKVEGLTVEFAGVDGDVTVVENVSFSIKPGEILGLVGESGCGKSVTSLSIIGLLPDAGRVSSGAIRFEGHDLLKLSGEEMRKLRGNRISMVFQEPLASLNPLFTVGEQIREVIALHKGGSSESVRRKGIDLLEKVGIPMPEKVYGSYPHSLSGGMRQRVMIAIALACRPGLVIADEPTTALDVTIQAQILELMRTLVRESGASILFITHDLGVIAEMADRVAVMYAGQIVEEGDVYSLFERPLHPYTQGLLKSTVRIHDVSDELDSIPGTVPTPKEMPGGRCRFADRCSSASGRCFQEEPSLVVVGDRSVRCLNISQGEETV